MPISELTNTTLLTAVPIKILYADTFWKRFLGLMGKKAIQDDIGLLFVQKRQSRVDSAIHMLFMRFDLAVFWLDESKTIVDRAIARKWHLSYLPSQPAKYILETHPDRFNDYRVSDVVEFP